MLEGVDGNPFGAERSSSPFDDTFDEPDSSYQCLSKANPPPSQHKKRFEDVLVLSNPRGTPLNAILPATARNEGQIAPQILTEPDRDEPETVQHELTPTNEDVARFLIEKGITLTALEFYQELLEEGGLKLPFLCDYFTREEFLVKEPSSLESLSETSSHSRMTDLPINREDCF
jgi:hypothetical protein